MANLSFEGSDADGWVCKMHYPEAGAVESTCFEGPPQPTTEEAMWALVDLLALEAAEYREIKQAARMVASVTTPPDSGLLR